MARRKIIMSLPDDMPDSQQAELANGIWAIAFGAISDEEEAPDVETVTQEMDRLWKAAPELTPEGLDPGHHVLSVSGAR